MKVIPFLVPSVEEQTAIVAFLDEKTVQIDEAIGIKERQIALLKERKQIIIQNAVTKGLNPNAPMKDSGVDWIGDIPAHWESVTKIKYISLLKGRQGWQGLKAEEYTDEGPHVLSSAHFNNFKIDWDKCPRVSYERYLMDENIQLKIRTKARPTGRLGLDGQGLQAPNKRKEVSAGYGWPKSRKGWKPNGQDSFSRLGPRQPGPPGCGNASRK